jgi:hypothetical protein
VKNSLLRVVYTPVEIFDFVCFCGRRCALCGLGNGVMRYDVSFDIIGRGGNGWRAGVLLFFPSMAGWLHVLFLASLAAFVLFCDWGLPFRFSHVRYVIPPTPLLFFFFFFFFLLSGKDIIFGREGGILYTYLCAECMRFELVTSVL